MNLMILTINAMACKQFLIMEDKNYQEKSFFELNIKYVFVLFFSPFVEGFDWKIYVVSGDRRKI